jgi:hypothetical protein
MCLDALDDQVARSDSANLRAHGDEQVAKIHDLGLARGVEQLRFPFGQNCRHDGVLRRADGHDREAEVAARKSPLGRGRLHIARGQLDLCAHRLERL